MTQASQAVAMKMYQKESAEKQADTPGAEGEAPKTEDKKDDKGDDSVEGEVVDEDK